jgi:hypothetical protein
MLPDRLVIREPLPDNHVVEVGVYAVINDVSFRCVSAHIDEDGEVTFVYVRVSKAVE